MTGNFYGPASCGWGEGWGCGLRRFRCECVCGETFASNCSILSSACSELGMCANSLSSASRVFFSLLPSAFLPAKYLDYRCRHKLCSPSDNILPCPLSPVPVVCRVRVPDQVQNVKFSPLLRCVCVCARLPRLKQLFDVCKFCSLSVSELPCSMRL